jgi:hypothetical protein
MMPMHSQYAQIVAVSTAAGRSFIDFQTLALSTFNGSLRIQQDEVSTVVQCPRLPCRSPPPRKGLEHGTDFTAVLRAALLSIGCRPLAAQTDDDTFANRQEALKAMTARDPQKRAEAIVWIAEHGLPSDDAALRLRLKDENPFVRHMRAGALGVVEPLGDDAIDALMERGIEQMQAQQFKAAIATFSEVIRRKPAFAEGWNKRATVLFLAVSSRGRSPTATR